MSTETWFIRWTFWMVFVLGACLCFNDVVDLDEQEQYHGDIHLQCEASQTDKYSSTNEEGVQCPSEIVVNWLRLSPYFYNITDTNATEAQFSGIFHEMLYHLKQSCVDSCVHNSSVSRGKDPVIKLKRTPISSYKSMLYELKLRSKDSSSNVTEIFFPLASPEIRQSTFYGLPFLFKITSPGAVLVRRTKGDTLSSLVVTGIKNSWQMLVLIMLLSVIVGALIWLAEHRDNSDFPPSFASGCWTGFWFAWVTMTTVGYGDKTPKTNIGKFLAVLWMTIGLCLFPVLVANFTSALQSSTKATSSIDGTKIAVVSEGPETRCALDQNANIVEKASYLEVLNAVASWEVDGGLIEKHAMRALLGEMKAKDLRPYKTFDCPINVGGVVVAPGNLSREFVKTMTAMSTQCVTQECRDSLVSKELSIEYQYEKQILFRVSSNNAARYDLHMLLIACAVLAAVIVTMGIVWQKILSRDTRRSIRQGVKSSFKAIFIGEAEGDTDSMKKNITPEDEIIKLKDELNAFTNRLAERLTALEKRSKANGFEMSAMS